jgi:hypothetical protein
MNAKIWLAGLALSGATLLGGATAAQAQYWDRGCSARVNQDQRDLNRAINNYGYYSRQARDERNELQRARANCSYGYNGYGYNGGSQYYYQGDRNDQWRNRDNDRNRYYYNNQGDRDNHSRDRDNDRNRNRQDRDGDRDRNHNRDRDGDHDRH